MELKKVQRKKERKTRRLNLQTTERASNWMKENNVSPQLIFDQAVQELMTKEK